MSYTPPEGVTIGSFTADTLPASFSAPADAVVTYKIYGTSEGVGVVTESGEPAGYKIPILLNITKTDFSATDGNIEQGGWDASTGNPIGIYSTMTRVRCSNYVTVNASTDIITIKSDLNLTGYQAALQLTDDTGICISGTNWYAFPFSLSMAGYSDSIKRAYIIIRKSDNNTLVPSDIGKISAYVAPPNSSNYDLFIGDSKLYEDEYLDFSEQKVYKRTENLFDVAKETLGEYLSTESGSLEPTVNSNTSDYIDVSLFNYVTIVLELDGDLHSTAAREWCGYDQNKQYIGPWGFGVYNVAGIQKVIVTINVTNIYYVRFDYDKSHTNIMLVEGSTAPETYIPYLQPTDPPVPLPAINTYKGENTLSSTETLGGIELTGDWLAIMGSTEDESIDIEFTVDAAEYIAFVTVDDDPQIQVSDTITMPSSASSFTLQVVSWGREQYTDTVYNALS